MADAASMVARRPDLTNIMMKTEMIGLVAEKTNNPDSCQTKRNRSTRVGWELGKRVNASCAGLLAQEEKRSMDNRKQDQKGGM